MVKKLVLIDKMHTIRSEKDIKKAKEAYLKYLMEFTKDFPDTLIKIKKLREFDKRFELVIQGPEEVFVMNLLKTEVGAITNFNEIDQNKVYRGHMVDVGKVKFGIFVDCGFLNPKADVLMNLHTLREQLCKGKKLSLNEIIRAYNFIDNFPVFVKLKAINVHKHEIEGQIEQESLSLFRKTINENLERVIVSGTTRRNLKNKLVKNNHYQDIISIQRFGFLEHIIVLKEGTNAPGIIASIGNDLRQCRMSAIRPKNIRGLFK